MHDLVAKLGLQTIGSSLGGIFGMFMSFAYGEIKGLLLWLLLFVLFDLLTGIFASWHTHSFASRKIFTGIIKKVLMFWIVALAHGLDQIFSSLLGSIALFQTITICAYAAGEFISIVENLCRAGYEDVVPPVLHRLITEVNGKFDKTGIEAFLPQGKLFHDHSRNSQFQPGEYPSRGPVAGPRREPK